MATIIINGHERDVDADAEVIDYETVCSMAGLRAFMRPSVIWSDAEGREGELTRGQSITNRPGLIFEAGMTGSA